MSWCNKSKRNDIKILIKFLLSSGLRIKELCCLNKVLVDLEKCEGYVIRDSTKSNSGARWFQFDNSLKDEIK